MDFSESTSALLQSYETFNGINHVDGANLPSKRAVSSICEDLLQLLFPGFHDVESIHSHDLPRVTAARLESIGVRLGTEICKSKRLGGEPDCPSDRALTITRDFLAGLTHVRELLHTDVEAAVRGDPAAESVNGVILSYPFVEAIAIQRSAHVLYKLGVPLISRMMTEWAHSRTGIDIHPGAQIGSHFFIDHGTGVVIGETSVIGKNVKLYQGVSLIARSLAGGQALRGQKRHPTIEDSVTIYASVTIIGGDTVVGAGSTIGASVFLTHDVPPRSLVRAEGHGVKVVNKDKRGTEDSTDPGGVSSDWQI